MVVQAAYFAWQVKQAADKVALAKLNAERERQGLPPLRPWYEDCFINTCAWTKETLVTAFCGICRHISASYQRTKGKTCFSRTFIDGTHENDMLKSTIGFLSGIFLSSLLVVVLILHMKLSPSLTLAIIMMMSPILSLGLAFSLNVRCLVLLMIPQLFSSKGRAFMLAYMFIIVINGPVVNFNKNIQVMSESATCGQMIAMDTTKEIMNSSMGPLLGVINTIRHILYTLVEFAAMLRKAFMSVKQLFTEVLGAIGRVFAWLGDMVNVCNKNMGAPYRKCKKAFDDGVRNCRQHLGILSFACIIADIASVVCHIVRIGDLLCMALRALRNFVADNIKSHIGLAFQDVYDMFYVNVTLTHHYNVTFEQSRTFTEIRDDIIAEIKQRSDVITRLLSWSNVFVMITFAWILIKAILYRRKYLSKDKFDNYYITLHVRKLDERREEMEKETILPLNFGEKGKYITTKNIRLAKPEKSKLIKGLVMLCGTGLHAGFYLALDYGLFWLLAMVRRHAAIRVNNEVPHTMQMHVEGDGVLADMYRSLITAFDPVEDVNPNIDTTMCLPNPHEPNLDTYRTIGFIFGLCTLLVLTEAYGLRLRHVVAGVYHPDRERERAVWLYNTILRSRGSFLKFMRRKLRKKSNEDEALEKISLKSRLAAKSPLIARVFKTFGYERKLCLCCGQPGKMDDMKAFKHCENHGCKAIYCMDCFTDINNLCTVCMSPVDYGDLSDMSEERDSSDENPLDGELGKGKKDNDRDSDLSDLDYSYQNKEKVLDSDASASDDEFYRRTPSPELKNAASIDEFGDDQPGYYEEDNEYQSQHYPAPLDQNVYYLNSEPTDQFVDNFRSPSVNDRDQVITTQPYATNVSDQLTRFGVTNAPQQPGVSYDSYYSSQGYTQHQYDATYTSQGYDALGTTPYQNTTFQQQNTHYSYY